MSDFIETAGVEPPAPKGAIIPAFLRVYSYYRECLTTLLTTFNRKYKHFAGASSD